MDQGEQIRRAYFIDAKSIRRIAREGHHDRRTVRKFLGDADPPRYTLKVPRRRPVLDPFRAVIDQWLKDDQDRPPKQRHTAHRIYDRLVSEFAFQGGDSTVREYVWHVRPRRQVMIPLDHDPGEAQVDWGEAQVYLDGRRTKVHLLGGEIVVVDDFGDPGQFLKGPARAGKSVIAFPRECFFADKWWERKAINSRYVDCVEIACGDRNDARTYILWEGGGSIGCLQRGRISIIRLVWDRRSPPALLPPRPGRDGSVSLPAGTLPQTQGLPSGQGRENVYRKLGVQTRAEAVRVASERGFLTT